MAWLLVAAMSCVGTHSVFAAGPGTDAPASARNAVPSPAAVSDSPAVIAATVSLGAYEIQATEEGHKIVAEGFGQLLVPGKPRLPSKIIAVAIPPGAELLDVTFDAGEGVDLPGAYAVPPAPLPRVIGQEDPVVYEQQKKRYEENLEAVYGHDDPYPQSVVEFVRTAGYRKYNLVDVRVTPFRYRPQSGALTRYPEITIYLSHTPPPQQDPVTADGPPRTETVAKEIIINHDEAQSWYPRRASAGRGLHDFVIITLDSLTSSVTPLVTWETDKGRTVQVVTTSWINANYTGDDLAQRMRNFLRDKYPSEEWGIEDVLLVGHYDDVPMRRTGQNLGYGAPETDFYYAELSLPDDQSWDSNDNGQYGEDGDAVDFYSEVNVGRIPWSTASTVLSICEKSVAYEQNEDPAFKKNILLLGGYFWADTDNAVLMEAKADQPWMADWTMTRMYEKNADYWSSYDCDYPLVHSNVMSVWPAGQYAFVDWAGHGSPTSCHIYGLGAPAFIQSSDCPSLNDDYPAIIFADACSNSDTDYLNIGQAMLEGGAVGFVGATKVALGCPGWNGPEDGSSQSLDYYFTTAVTSGEYTQGQAHQRALREMYVNSLWDYTKYEMFQWGALWGNPGLRLGSSPILSIRFPEGLPEYLEPGALTSFTVQIKNGVENYVPGTGTLHYRYDGGGFLTASLTHDMADYYIATLPPAGCGAMPEYYISAEGDGGSTILSPSDAPNTVYTAVIGTLTAIMSENLDVNPGWTTQGLWAFGQPTGGGGQYGGPDPTSGHTGNNVYGYNLSGDYENNLPERHLTTPAIDCSGVTNVTLKFRRWLGVEQSTWDHAYVRVSNNGSSWTTVWQNGGEVADGTWGLHEYDISSVADDQATVYLRWTMGPTDTAWQYCGWNIDDVELWGLLECEPSEDVVTPLPENSLGIANCTDDDDCAGEARCVLGICYAPKHRYISVAHNPMQPMNTARRIKLQSSAVLGWAGEPYLSRGLWVANVVSSPVYPGQWPDVLHLTDCQIATGQTYEVQAILMGDDPGAEANYSTALPLHTASVWGDTVWYCEEDVCLPPNGIVNLDDIIAGIRKFQGAEAIPLTWVDIAPSTDGDRPDQVINVEDILACIQGFQGEPYPGKGPLNCP